MSMPAGPRRWIGRTPQTIRNNGCFACGPANLRGLHLDVQNDGDVTYIEFTPDESWQGFGGVVHGGLVATVLDEVMAWELYGYDDFAVTGRMEITYRKLVPVGQRLRATAKLVLDRGRAKKVHAEIRDDQDMLLATADSLFISIPKEQEAELRRRYPDASRPGTL
ncbi:MAG: PaaI family thioesterase [Chloroflexota bacterium]